MINQFLRLGGVNSLEEFYRKFPTEVHFDQHVHHMKYGGMYAYAPGGETGDESTTQLDANDPTYAMAKQIEAGSKAAPSTAKPSTYGGVSIVDYLNQKGKATNFASRKKLAESLGMNSYTGKPSENLGLIKMIESNPDVLKKYETMSEPKKAVRSTTPQSNGVMVNKQSWYPPMLPPGQEPAFQGMPFLGQNLQFQQPTRKAVTPTKKNSPVVGKDNGVRPYAPTEPSFQGMPWLGQKRQPVAKTSQKTSAPISGTKADARNLESGMIEDKNKNVMYVVKGGKVIKTFPIMTGKTRNSNIAGKSVAWMDAHPDQANQYKVTPTGTFLSVPNKDIYGKPGFNKKPIAAFGEPASTVTNLAQHLLYGTGPKGSHGYDPAEGSRRLDIMKLPGEQRNASYGCTNMYGDDIDCLTKQLFPKGDTTITIDTRRPMDQQFLKRYGIKKMGGEPCYDCGGAYARGGQTLHPGGDGTYYQGNFFDDGGTFVPDYGDAAYGQLPQYEMGKAMYGSGVMELGGPTYSDVTQYNHQEYVPAFDWMQDGGSPLYSTQGQPLRNFMNTVGYTPGGWMPNHFELPPVGKYDDGGMAPQMPAQPQMGPPDQQQGPVGTPGQGGGGIDPQQVMQIAAQKLQQGEQPEQVMQELVQAGVPQDMAQQIIQQVMQQLQASQGQQAGEEMMENPEQQGPQEELEEGQAPQAMYGLGMKYGGSTNKKGKFAKNYEVGGEYEMSNSDIQKLIAQGYKLQYL